MFKRKSLIIFGIIFLLILLIFSILNSADLSINLSADNSEVSFEAKFPNAKCQKIFKRNFPFFEFKCTPIAKDTNDIEKIKTKDSSQNITDTAKESDNP